MHAYACAWLHEYACAWMHTCMCIFMHAWVYEHLAACACVCMRAYMRVCVHACVYLHLQFPLPPPKKSIEVGLAGFAPPPSNIEKLPTPMIRTVIVDKGLKQYHPTSGHDI